jgi:hypothetical protein
MGRVPVGTGPAGIEPVTEHPVGMASIRTAPVEAPPVGIGSTGVVGVQVGATAVLDPGQTGWPLTGPVAPTIRTGRRRPATPAPIRPRAPMPMSP